ncbi:hypothetical protein L2E82_33274 [Cichorium intybus]|uniref:Uncharacterized protein n=1 Tax=Cichorium intybus TaxID=13427 RepID=A0ACB9BJY6_CICIN|nr:hypothetical protein L2E82_33274 [Cichorium intybus]
MIIESCASPCTLDSSPCHRGRLLWGFRFQNLNSINDKNEKATRAEGEGRLLSMAEGGGASLLDFDQPATVNTLNLITRPILITINQKRRGGERKEHSTAINKKKILVISYRTKHIRQEPAIALTHFLSHLFSQFRSFSEFRH